MAKALSIILSEVIGMEERTQIMLKAKKMNLTTELINNLRELRDKKKTFNKEEIYKLLKEMKIKD